MPENKLKPSLTTVPRDIKKLSEKTDNLYKSIVIMGKRADQIAQQHRAELNERLQEFISYADTLDEVHECEAQIEVSRYYERLPKPSLVALEEMMNDRITFQENNAPDGAENGVNQTKSQDDN